ncbi:MAG: sulfur carrier protein ThiS [Candidatus Gastranaerophilales bacterium]|nr:sulfur carrier protein ThiS [Candidatus Gastranaerophilales bacterium]
MIQITVNGNSIKIKENACITDVLEMQNLSAPMFAVEKNRQIIPKSEYNSCILKEGDNIEIVSFVGGG